MFNWLKRKSAATAEVTNDLGSVEAPKERNLTRVQVIEDGCIETQIGEDWLGYFSALPEVFFPIDFIAKRISEAHFDIKRIRDDSLIICDRTGVGKFLKSPNPLMSWREIVYRHFIYKLATGNAYLRAALPESLSSDVTLFRWCDHYWSLPSNLVKIQLNNGLAGVPLFGIADKEDIIKGYQLTFRNRALELIPPHQIWHDRDSLVCRFGMNAYITGDSRLKAVRKNISNLFQVYAARNIIYKKRGAIGFLVSEKKDETGTVAMTPQEKESLRKEYNDTYGFGSHQFPYGITDIPMKFIHTNMSIQELMPFEEVLEDSIKIAAIYGIPSVLVPRKDQSTYSNQDTAEKAVYTSVIIPMAKRFCDELTTFLGLDTAGYYLDCNFDDVACMQAGLKEQAEVKKLVNEVCNTQFNCGLITINDWRARIHMPALEGEIYNKVKFEMTPEELAIVDSIIKNQSPIQINTTSGNGETNNHKPSTEEDGND